MVKSVLGTNHQGLRDWLYQRLTALVIVIYALCLISFMFFNPHPTFSDWQAMFSPVWVRVLTLGFIVSVLFHSWVGLWTVFTDYIKIFSVRLMLQVALIFGLLACLFWSAEILWGLSV